MTRSQFAKSSLNWWESNAAECRRAYLRFFIGPARLTRSLYGVAMITKGNPRGQPGGSASIHEKGLGFAQESGSPEAEARDALSVGLQM